MIRRAEKGDVPAIKRLMRSEPGFWQDCWREDAVERGLAASDGIAFVCEEAGQIVGFACAHDLGYRAYLSELIASRSCRRQGIGRKLVERVQQELTARGCAILIADAFRDAEEFYRSLGWEEPDVILLRKRLMG
jgi:ribosomal protein S18 acetylase RimI-like enzyme